MLLVCIISQWHYILNVVYEMADALKIKVFRVSPKEPKEMAIELK
jgi:hypothetical protein